MRNEMLLEEKTIGNYKIRFGIEEFAENPFEMFPPEFEMFTKHSRRSFYNNTGCKDYYGDYESEIYQELKDADGYFTGEYGEQKPDIRYVFDLNMYEHSGIAFRVDKGFSCPWDSGQLGFIVIRKGTCYDGMSREEILKNVRSHIDNYQSYINGEVYAFDIVDIRTGEIIESNGDLYGYKESLDYLVKEVEEYNKQDEFNRFVALTSA